MPEESAHLVKTGTAAQPTRRGEVAQGVRVQTSIQGQTSLGAQPV